MAVCVPQSGKAREWFTKLAKDLNVSEAWLEPRIHSFWNKYGESATPTVENMQEFINGKITIGTEDQITVWEAKYKTPIQFEVYEDAVAYVNSITELPKESVIIKTLSDGLFEVSVTKPTLSDKAQESEIVITEKEPKTEKQTQEDKVNAEVNALTNNQVGLTATEVSELAAECVYWISDLLTSYLEDPSIIFKTEKFAHLRTLSPSGEYTAEAQQRDIARIKEMSRAELFGLLGARNILDFCRESLFTANNKYLVKFANRTTKNQARFLYQNFDGLMQKAMAIFTETEGFSIKLDKNGEYEIAEANESEINPNDDNINNDNDIEVARENGTLAWSIDRRTESIMSSMSQLVRSELTKLYQIDGYDSEGNPIYRKSRFGVNQRVDAKKATEQIVSWIQGSITLQDMVNRLQAQLKHDKNGKPTKNLWLTQLLSKLYSAEGQPNDNYIFQSQFFGVFNKHFQPYSIIIKDGNTFKSIPINEMPALKEAMNSIKAMYKTDQHPLFSLTSGIRNEALPKVIELIDEAQSLLLYGQKIKNVEGIVGIREQLVNALTGVYYYLGYMASSDMVDSALSDDAALVTISTALKFIKNSLNNAKNDSTYDPFQIKNNPNGINGRLKELLTPITNQLEDSAISSFYDSGKMYQSYVTPSYMTKLMNKFRLEGAEFMKFINETYGDSEWFHLGTNEETGWRTPWLRELITRMDEKQRKDMFVHKVELSFNKHNYMRTMNDVEYALSVFTEYMIGTGKEDVAYYRLPILSNKPSAEYISFKKYTLDSFAPDAKIVGRGKQTILDGMFDIFDQEMSRIKTFRLRAESGIKGDDPRVIKNFDKNGQKFMFLDFLNPYLNGDKKDTALGKLIAQKLEGTDNTDELRAAVREVIQAAMEARVESILAQWKTQGIYDAIKKSDLAGKEDLNIENAIRGFIWNDTFAAMNIMQLTITDAAQYKNAEDLQKRFSQIHAPGIRANVTATDARGVRVSNGSSKTVYLRDFDGIISNVIENITEVFNRKIAQAATQTEKDYYTELLDSLVREEVRDENGKVIKEAGAYRQINLADAQAYSCPTSLRKKMIMFGKWDAKKEAMYQKLRKRQYTYDDVKALFSQPLKPFVYSQISVPSGVEGPITTFKVGLQNKNSEYLLIMADAILQGEETGKPNLLRAIYQVMEESHYENGDVENGQYKWDGIDTFQFSSAVKAGLSGEIDVRAISGLYPTDKTISPKDAEAEAKRILKEAIEGQPDVYVKTFSYEDYSIQQEVPEHFRDHEQAFGSQTRYIIPSDLEADAEYTYFDPATGKVEAKNARQFKEEYEKTIAENIAESLKKLSDELLLDGNYTPYEKNLALSKILRREILASPRYGIDLLQACSLNEEGKFNIPLGDPIQSKRVEQLLNSIIKDRVNKQKVAGGPVVQVSNFGTSRSLNIRFKDKDTSELLPTKEEYTGTIPYKKFIEDHQGGIAYWEVYAPITSNSIFAKFADENGNIDIKAIEDTDPELLTILGYRIPTEDKYSIIPMKIVGFLPKEAGEAIMMPADVTTITGSDFDVDKMYLHFKELNLTPKSRKEITDAMLPVLKRSKLFRDKSDDEVRNQIQMFLDNPERMKSIDNEMKAIAHIYRRAAFRTIPPVSGREYRNNKMIDMALAVLTHATTADKMLNPGGFEKQKRVGYKVAAIKAHPELSWDALPNEVEALKDLFYTDKNLCFIDTQVQFYKQNNAAGTILGMFAVQKVAHAALEGDGFSIDIARCCNLPMYQVVDDNGKPMFDFQGEPIMDQYTFTVAGMEFGNDMEIDGPYDRTHTVRIGKTLGSLVASAADAVKDSVLNLMNINNQTASVLNTLIRLGMPFEDAALFLSQKAITDALAEADSRSLASPASLTTVIADTLAKINKENPNLESSNLEFEELTKDELIAGLTSDSFTITYKVLKNYLRFNNIASAIRGLTLSTRYNSVASAVGPLAIDNLTMVRHASEFSDYVVDQNGNEVKSMDQVFVKHPILGQFYKTYQMAERLLSDMPANSTGFRNLTLGTLSDKDQYGKLADVIFGDRKLLSQLSDFYQSYLLVQSEVSEAMAIPSALDRMCYDAKIKDEKLDLVEKLGKDYQDPAGLKYFITEFPKLFIGKDSFKEKYAGNKLIDAIKVTTEGKFAFPVLKVDITGLDTRQKELLGAAWADLHKIDPKLSVQLFLYNFYRGGIGFTPKTFMSLLPAAVKMSPEFAAYRDTFRKLPSVGNKLVIDQFIRNNGSSSKLVPSVRPDTDVTFIGNKVIALRKEADIKDLGQYPYIRMKRKGVEVLYKRTSYTTAEVKYEEVSSLGSNKAYIEMAANEITTAMEDTVLEVEEATPNVTEAPEVENTPVELGTTESVLTYSDTQLTQLMLAAYTIQGVRTKDTAARMIDDLKNASPESKKGYRSGLKSFLMKKLPVLKAKCAELNIQFDETVVDKLVNKFC